MLSNAIKTERLILRRFVPQDAARVVDLIGNLNVARWMTSVPHPYVLDDALGFFKRHDGPYSGVYAVTLDDAVIGCTSIDAEFGYWLGEPYWGRGFATEAGRAFIDQHFAGAGSDLLAGYILGNAASQNVLTKLGFRPSHMDVSTNTALNSPVTIQKMVLKRTDWQAA